MATLTNWQVKDKAEKQIRKLNRMLNPAPIPPVKMEIPEYRKPLPHGTLKKPYQVCVTCGKPRSASSGRQCMQCYRKDVVDSYRNRVELRDAKVASARKVLGDTKP